MPDSRNTDTRRALMEILLTRREGGATLDELARQLGVTRNAVRQHVTALERDGLVEAKALRPTGRRPSRTYGLTVEGGELFPRQYDLLALKTLEAVRDALGEEAVEAVLDSMVEELARAWLPELEALEATERRERVAAIMNQLGYHARATEGGVSAINCVFHKVARETRAVCRFDERLLSRLLGDTVRLSHCMADGDDRCAFSRLAAAATRPTTAPAEGQPAEGQPAEG